IRPSLRFPPAAARAARPAGAACGERRLPRSRYGARGTTLLGVKILPVGVAPPPRRLRRRGPPPHDRFAATGRIGPDPPCRRSRWGGGAGRVAAGDGGAGRRPLTANAPGW